MVMLIFDSVRKAIKGITAHVTPLGDKPPTAHFVADRLMLSPRQAIKNSTANPVGAKA